MPSVLAWDPETGDLDHLEGHLSASHQEALEASECLVKRRQGRPITCCS